jgi:lysophospholipase L1-like esterase
MTADQAPARRERRPISRKKKVAFSLALLVLLLVLLEGGMRVARFILAPGVQTAGAADDSRALVFLCVGDSLTYGLGAKRGEAYPVVLAPALQAVYGGLPVKTYNLGMAGISSSHALGRVAEFFRRRPFAKVDYALVLVGVNNRWNLQDASFWQWEDGSREDSPLRHLVSQFQLNKAFSVLAEKTRSIGRPDSEIRGRAYKDMLDKHGWDVFFSSFDDPLLARWLEADTLEMTKLLRDHGVEPIFLTYHYGRFPELNPLLQRAAAKAGAGWINTELPMAYYVEARMLDRDQFHLNAKGYRDLARRIAFEFWQQHRIDDLRARIAAKQADPAPRR